MRRRYFMMGRNRRRGSRLPFRYGMSGMINGRSAMRCLPRIVGRNLLLARRVVRINLRHIHVRAGARVERVPR
jgi:hypothetical protein